MHPGIATTLACLMVLNTTAAGAKQKVRQPPATVAQDLVTRFLAAHSGELAAVELALDTGDTCRTVAATHVEDVGERCDADERTAMRSGRPYVEAPTKADPIYDVTQALHDVSGTLIGAIGMDLKPQAGDTRAIVVARARGMLRLLEAQIPSAQKLLEQASR